MKRKKRKKKWNNYSNKLGQIQTNRNDEQEDNKSNDNISLTLIISTSHYFLFSVRGSQTSVHTWFSTIWTVILVTGQGKARAIASFFSCHWSSYFELNTHDRYHYFLALLIIMAFDNFADKLMHLLTANVHVNQVKQI